MDRESHESVIRTQAAQSVVIRHWEETELILRGVGLSKQDLTESLDALNAAGAIIRNALQVHRETSAQARSPTAVKPGGITWFRRSFRLWPMFG